MRKFQRYSERYCAETKSEGWKRLEREVNTPRDESGDTEKV